jgi:hypothetical protein
MHHTRSALPAPLPPLRRPAAALAATSAGLAAALALALSACALDPDDEAGGGEPPATAAVEQAGSAYRPMGFARVTTAGGLRASFNSTGAAVSVARLDTGRYTVTFASLGTSSTSPGARGNVHLTAEGSGVARCQILDWTAAAPSVVVRVECYSTYTIAADTDFAVLYVRDTVWPSTPGTSATRSAYTRVTASGTVLSSEDYNSSGVHNTAVRTDPGITVVTVPGAATANASILITPHVGAVPGAISCALRSWAGNRATVECRAQDGALVDTSFTFLFSTSGPSVEQQSAHGLFDGTALADYTVGALGKVTGCSPASLTMTRTGSLISLTVSGDYGSWDASPLVRASFATKLGAAGYCKIESLSTSGVAPSTTSTSRVRCYSSTGREVAYPGIWFTQTTSSPAGPC